MKKKLIKIYLWRYKLYNKKNFNLINNKEIEVKDIEKEVLKLEPKIRNRYLLFILICLIIIGIIFAQEIFYYIIILLVSIVLIIGTIKNKRNLTIQLRLFPIATLLISIILLIVNNYIYNQYILRFIQLIFTICLIGICFYFICKSYIELKINKKEFSKDKLKLILKANNIYDKELYYNLLSNVDKTEINVKINQINKNNYSCDYLLLNSSITTIIFIILNILGKVSSNYTATLIIVVVYLLLNLLLFSYYFINYYKRSIFEFVYEILIIIFSLLWFAVVIICILYRTNYFILSNYLVLNIYRLGDTNHSTLYMFDGIISIVGLLISISYFIIRYISNRNIRKYKVES